MRVFVLLVLSACGRIGFDPSSAGDDGGVPLCQARDVDVGRNFGCLVDTVGDIYCWGHNTNGQVLPALNQKPGRPDEGPPLIEFVTTPGRVTLRAQATKVAVGREFSCALLQDGEVWCWGAGALGQLGDGLMADSTSPVKVALGNVAVDDLDAGAHTACVRVTADRSLMCWGASQAGQLGQVDPSPVPIAIPNSAGVANLDLGHRHNCATMDDGRLVCWGRGDNGQLGPAVGGPQLVTIASVGAVSHAAATGRTTCAVRTDGDVACLGSDNGGKLGDNGQTAMTATPMRIPLSLDAVEVQIGIAAACARHANGTVTCWGEDLKGDGTFDRGKSPRPTLLADASKIVMSYSMACAIEAGIVVCWGPNENGQLGRGSRSIATSPIVVDLDPLVPVEVGVGERHACARSATAVACWGDNASNQVGDNSGLRRISPTPVATGLATIDGMAVGTFTTCVWSGAVVKCWGAGANGVETGAASGTIINAMTIGHAHGCEIVDGTSLFCRGENGSGQIGDGTTNNADVPVAITLPGTPTAIAAGRDHTCAIEGGGNVRCWGAGGTIGDGTANQSLTPTLVTLPNLATAIVAGDGSTCALTSVGEVLCWGKNNAGECGVGDYAPYLTPVVVTLPATATKLAMHQNVMCAQLSTGDVSCWGSGRLGQLGDGAATDSPAPVAVPGLANATSLAAGGLGGCAIVNSGLVCWGDSAVLGNGDDSAARPLPVDFTTCP